MGPAADAGKRAVAKVDGDKCVGCGACVDACRWGAIAMQAIAEIDPGRCTGCGECIGECPANALSLDRQARALGARS